MYDKSTLQEIIYVMYTAWDLLVYKLVSILMWMCFRKDSFVATNM